MASCEVGRKCMLCCGLWRKREEAPDTTDKDPEEDYANKNSVENDMQPTDYYNINDLKELYHSGDPNAALYEEVPREEHRRPAVDSGPIYAEAAVAVRLNVKGSVKPPRATPRSLSVKEKQERVSLEQILGDDGTLYMDVRRTLPKNMSSKVHKPLFNKSEYAFIDHTVQQIPPPPKFYLSSRK